MPNEYSNEQSTSIHDSSENSKLSEMLSPGDTLMVAPAAPLSLARPLTISRVENDQIFMLVDSTVDWLRRLNNGDPILVTHSDSRKNVWVSLYGQMEMSRDQQLIDSLWNPAASAYFNDGRDSAGIAVMIIEVEAGEYWSSPAGRLGSIISLLKARFGDPADSRDHGTVELT